MSSFNLGFYCGICAMGFCYYLVFGQYIYALLFAIGGLFYAHKADSRVEGS